MTASHYTQQERQRAAERETAPKTCPHCGTPINQNLQYWDQVRYHCGETRCRKAISRASIAERKRRERSETHARILAYCEQRLDAEQGKAVKKMTETLMQWSVEEGHHIAEQVINVIEQQRCRHDRISVLIDNANAAKRRAEKAEEYNRELQALYQRRIEELEAELHVYQLLEGAIHNIATRQLEKQPDPQPQAARPVVPEPDPDRAAVLATLARAGIKPVEEALAEAEQEDDTEDGEYQSDQDHEDTER